MGEPSTPLEPGWWIRLVRGMPKPYFAAMVMSTWIVISLLFLIIVAFNGPLGIPSSLGRLYPWILGAWVISGPLTLAEILMALKPKMQRRASEKEGRAHLRMLTPGEKQLLRQLMEGTGSVQLREWTGPLESLERAKVLYTTSDGRVRAYIVNIEPWAYAHLKKHPDLIGEARQSTEDHAEQS